MAKANEIKYLTAIKTEKPKKKFCRFKKYGMRYIDYKDAEFLKTDPGKVRDLQSLERQAAGSCAG